MPLARTFAYADAHRARIGVNYKQIPVNAPKAPVHSTPRTARCASSQSPTGVRTQLQGGLEADRPAAEVLWHADGDMMRTAYTLRADDDDWGQAGILLRDVMDDAERDRLVFNVAGHLRNGVTEQVLERAFEYWKNIDKDTGEKIEAALRNGSS